MRERLGMNGMPMLIAAAFLVLGSTFSAPISSDEDVRLESARLEGTEFSAQTRQRPRVRIERDQPAAYDYPRPGPYAWPGPGMVRRCVDWYATEYRPSGTVVTPQMRCRWVRG
jgi:hypothetical protein